MNEDVICRWRHTGSGLAIDVMPIAEDVLGFSNPWYTLGIETAIERTLASGKRIRAVAPAVVIATKLAAWLGRGHGDLLRSLDLHDIIVLINGRTELIDELSTQNDDLRSYVRTELTTLRENTYFDYLIQSAVAGYAAVAPARAEIVRNRVDAIISRLADS